MPEAHGWCSWRAWRHVWRTSFRTNSVGGDSTRRRQWRPQDGSTPRASFRTPLNTTGRLCNLLRAGLVRNAVQRPAGQYGRWFIVRQQGTPDCSSRDRADIGSLQAEAQMAEPSRRTVRSEALVDDQTSFYEELRAQFRPNDLRVGLPISLLAEVGQRGSANTGCRIRILGTEGPRIKYVRRSLPQTSCRETSQ